MKTYCDTSFLVSLYLTDSNSHKAIVMMQKVKTALMLTPFQSYELRNALRLCVFRKLIDHNRCQNAFEDIQDDLQNGILIAVPLAWAEILRIAEKLSASHTAILGNRALDILHIASAITLEATHFFTFDQRQHELAERLQLKLNP